MHPRTDSAFDNFPSTEWTWLATQLMHAPDDANVPSAWVVLGGSTLGPWLGGEDVLHFLTQPPNGGPSAYWNDTGSLVNPCTGTLVTRSFIIEFSADCNNDGIVDAADLTFVLNNWGVCS